VANPAAVAVLQSLLTIAIFCSSSLFLLDFPGILALSHSSATVAQLSAIPRSVIPVDRG
jgi:hypothetical protein